MASGWGRRTSLSSEKARKGGEGALRPQQGGQGTEPSDLSSQSSTFHLRRRLFGMSQFSGPSLFLHL